MKPISKSQYTQFIQCPKLFWLYRNAKHKLSPPEDSQLHIFETGTEVGELACQLFPGGKKIELDFRQVHKAAKESSQLIKKGETLIYEASFLIDGFFAAIDILNFRNGEWHLYEVKSSTRVKDIHIADAAFQAHLVRGSGHKLGSINIVYLNKNYERASCLDLANLFTIVDITHEANNHMKVIPLQMLEMKSILTQDEPSQSIGVFCTKPYPCAAKKYCWQELNQIPEYSIFNLNRASMKEKVKLYEQGLSLISEVSCDGRSQAQQLQIKELLQIKKEKIIPFISLIQKPVIHLDFETFMQAIPEYPGVRPFSHIPFQYSIHVQQAEGFLKHFEFLANPLEDPRRALAMQLINDIPPKGTILAYNSSFEINVIKRLAAQLTDLSPCLLKIANRISDLMIPFREKWYYDPLMQGSYSIKKVLPALVPEMQKAYQSLPGVRKGDQAATTWHHIIALSMKLEENKGLTSFQIKELSVQIEQMRAQLLAYCQLDTLAMVKLLHVLSLIK